MLNMLGNIFQNSLKRKNIAVIKDRVLTRIKDRHYDNQEAPATLWAAKHAQDQEKFAININADLWFEAKDICNTIDAEGNEKLAALSLGFRVDHSDLPLLYFLTRLIRAQCVIETSGGVGWSTQAFLKALEANQNDGQLYSSDFPCLSFEDPEQYLGYIVDDDLKQNWHPYIDGNKFNLPEIKLDLEKPVDLVHYNSGHYVTNRHLFLNELEEHLSDKAIIIFNNIQKNFHFRDLVNNKKWDYKIFHNRHNYIGVTGPYLKKHTPEE